MHWGHRRCDNIQGIFPWQLEPSSVSYTRAHTRSTVYIFAVSEGSIYLSRVPRSRCVPAAIPLWFDSTPCFTVVCLCEQGRARVMWHSSPWQRVSSQAVDWLGLIVFPMVHGKNQVAGIPSAVGTLIGIKMSKHLFCHSPFPHPPSDHHVGTRWLMGWACISELSVSLWSWGRSFLAIHPDWRMTLRGAGQEFVD